MGSKPDLKRRKKGNGYDQPQEDIQGSGHWGNLSVTRISRFRSKQEAIFPPESKRLKRRREKWGNETRKLVG